MSWVFVCVPGDHDDYLGETLHLQEGAGVIVIGLGKKNHEREFRAYSCNLHSIKTTKVCPQRGWVTWKYHTHIVLHDI